jgi:protein transport protein SEC61 subunit gamma-like protein
MLKLLIKLKSFFKECKRVFQITKKPSAKEFKTIVKVSAIGIAVIGIIGFIVSIISQIIMK